VCKHLFVYVHTCVCVCASERERVCVCRYCGGDAAQLVTVLGDGGNVHKYLVCVRACVCV